MSKVQIIRDAKDRPVFAVVPWDDYKALAGADDAELIEAGRAAANDETFPAEVAKRLMRGEAPLKVLREWRGFSQSELGDKTHVAPQYISQIERGERGIGKETAKKLAPVLGVSLDALLM